MPSPVIQSAYEHAADQRIEDFLPSPIQLAESASRIRSGAESPGAAILEQVYHRGFCGAFIDTDDNPQWARKIAKYERDALVAEARCTMRAEEIIASDRQQIGRGKRACHWNKYLERSAKSLAGRQNYGNCVAWSLREILGLLWSCDIDLREENHKWIERVGTAVPYGSRGHRGQGTYGGTMVKVAHNVGIQLELSYLDGKYDLRKEDHDEWYGNYWGGRGGPPKALKEEIKNDRLEQFAWVTEEDAIMDLLYEGYFGMHGSNYTARTVGKLISPLRRIGGHEQAVIGYDDTDEFREWYEQKTGERITEPVFIQDQSWGPWNLFAEELWPQHLWGVRPEGVWVILARDFRKIYTQWNDLIFVSNILGFPADPVPEKHCPTCTCTAA